MAVNWGEITLGRRSDSSGQEVVRAVLDLDLIKAGCEEEAFQDPRGRQEVVAKGSATSAVYGVDEPAAARVRDPEYTSRPKGRSDAAGGVNLRQKVRKDIEAHRVVKGGWRQRRRFHPEGVQGHVRGQFAPRADPYERLGCVEGQHAARRSRQLSQDGG